MSFSSKFKAWAKENIPAFAFLWENKYIGMAYDRFASLPPQQQKRITLGVVFGILLAVTGYLFLSYLTLWGFTDRINEADKMAKALQEHQQFRSSKGSQLQLLERNNQLEKPGALKKLLDDEGRRAAISPRSIQVTEDNASGLSAGEEENTEAIKMKRATVKIERVNLKQLNTFLKNIELGRYNLGISSIKVLNDDKIRGYMNIEMGIVAYLFSSGREA